jgi:hypothetical protein
MKKEFEVLKGQPRVTIQMTRDSVAAGDDCDAPHAREVETYSFLDPTALIRSVHPGYLPSVSGAGHSWDCIFNDRFIATITVHGIEPKAREVEYRADNRLHFVYRSASF